MTYIEIGAYTTDLSKFETQNSRSVSSFSTSLIQKCVRVWQPSSPIKATMAFNASAFDIDLQQLQIGKKNILIRDVLPCFIYGFLDDHPIFVQRILAFSATSVE